MIENKTVTNITISSDDMLILLWLYFMGAHNSNDIKIQQFLNDV